jgi:hypothetical protein
MWFEGSLYQPTMSARLAELERQKARERGELPLSVCPNSPT